MIGRDFGSYRILEILGRGGMGTVYRAHDNRLGRDVALKLLLHESNADPTAEAQLVREARAAAVLNHPNICVVYEVGVAEGQPYIAMELVGGRTLGDAIPARGLPIEDVLRYGAQIADALAHAHERGVIHRDLKGSNVALTSDGRAKVLDFGLARVGAPGAVDGSALTRTGSVGGTPQFMAPELLRGQPADARSDVWALGVLLHEMAAGELPFQGKTPIEVGAEILNAPANPLPDRIPAGLRAVVERCLSKDPARRFARASEVRAALEALAHGRAPHAETRAGSRSRFGLVAAVGAGVVALALGAAWFAWRRPAQEPDLGLRQITSNPDGAPVIAAAISPDGTYLAYADEKGAYVRTIESGDTRPLEIPQGATIPQVGTWADWYPDGTRVLVSARASDGVPTVWSMPILGGTARKVVVGGSQAIVSPDGTSIAFVRSDSTGPGLWTAASDGGGERRIARSDSSGLISFLSAAWSPRGSRIAYARRAARGDGRPFILLESADLDGRHRAFLPDSLSTRLHPLTALAWMPDGRIFFALEDPPPNGGQMNLWSEAVDPYTGAPKGRAEQRTHLLRVSYPVVSKPSTDGKHMAVTMLRYPTDIYLGDVERPASPLRNVRRLTLDDRDDDLPEWTPDSRSVLFFSDRNGTYDIYEQSIDTTVASSVAAGPRDQYAPGASADGRWIVYWDAESVLGQGSAPRLMKIPVGGGPAAELASPSWRGSYALASHAARGVFMESHGDSLIFRALDPDHGLGAVLLRLRAPDPNTWDLSPDGGSIALSLASDSPARIRIYDLASGAERVVQLDDRIGIVGLMWEPRGDGWYCYGTAEDGWHVIHVGHDGHATRILPTLPWMRGFAVSPDGRHLAFARNTVASNAWLLEGF